MKKMNILAVSITAALALGAATMTSCNKNGNEPDPDEPQKLTLTARIDAPETRVGIVDGDGGALKTTWREFDEIRVSNPATQTSEIFNIDEISEDGLTATFTGSISTTGGTLHAFYGLGEPDWERNRVVSRDLGYYYMQADNGDMAHLDNFAILQGSFTAEDPTITFYHSMAFFKITLTLPDGEAMPDLSEGGYAEITLDVPTAQYLYMDLGTGEWIEDDDPWSKGILKVNVQGIDPEDTEVVGYMAVFPSDVSGHDIALKMEFADGMGGSVAYTKTIAAKATRLIESGHYYTVTAQMEIPSVENLDGGSITPLTPEEF